MFRPTILLFTALTAALTACQGAEVTPTSHAVLQPPVLSVGEIDPETMPPDEIAVSIPEIAPEAPDETTYAMFTLRRGETLAHFARWSGHPVEEIAEASGLDLGGSYPVGTEIRVPVSGEEGSLLEEKRESHREMRVEGYLGSRGGSVGTEFVKVRTGDTAWNIAQDTQGIPIWVLEAYNPSVDLDRLRPGQELMVPVLADVVVDAETTPEATSPTE